MKYKSRLKLAFDLNKGIHIDVAVGKRQDSGYHVSDGGIQRLIKLISAILYIHFDEAPFDPHHNV